MVSGVVLFEMIVLVATVAALEMVGLIEVVMVLVVDDDGVVDVVVVVIVAVVVVVEEEEFEATLAGLFVSALDSLSKNDCNN